MTIKEVTRYLESKFPLSLQEDFDNCGVQCGDVAQEVSGVMVCFEMSDAVIGEAVSKNCNLVISHHPLILRHGITKVVPTDRVGSMICKALKNNIVLYSMHTNIDSGEGGGNDLFAEKLKLLDIRVLSPHQSRFRKLAVNVPESHVESLKAALFEIGCGEQGNYRECCFSLAGMGQFIPADTAKPYVGNRGSLETVGETRLEMIYPSNIQQAVIRAIYENHPYEEPAFDLIPLSNTSRTTGLGRIGQLPEEQSVPEFLDFLKKSLGLEHLRFCGNESGKVKTVAVCGGGGASFIDLAIAQGADAYVSGDFKYHDFFKSYSGTLLVDIGHYEGECFIKNIIFNLLKEKFTTFAVLNSETEGISVKYY